MLGFTGVSNVQSPYLNLVVKGNPFPDIKWMEVRKDFFKYHIKPQPLYFNKFYEDRKQIGKIYSL
jgi:hypothetical protein